MMKHTMHLCHYFGKQIIRTYFFCTDKCFPLVRPLVLAIYSQLFFEASLRFPKPMTLYEVPVIHI